MATAPVGVHTCTEHFHEIYEWPVIFHSFDLQRQQGLACEFYARAQTQAEVVIERHAVRDDATPEMTAMVTQGCDRGGP